MKKTKTVIRIENLLRGYPENFRIREASDYDGDLNEPKTINTESHYKGKESLYKFCEEWKLNSYEFDLIKRIVRCRHKGKFVSDLEKTKALIDIYLTEQGDNFPKTADAVSHTISLASLSDEQLDWIEKSLNREE